MKRFAVVVENGDRAGSERVECECDTSEEAEHYLEDRPHLIGRVVDRATLPDDYYKDAIA